MPSEAVNAGISRSPQQRGEKISDSLAAGSRVRALASVMLMQ
jgi:hypothetical protein